MALPELFCFGSGEAIMDAVSSYAVNASDLIRE